MPHIPLRVDLPGIAGLLTIKPETGAKVAELMHHLLRGASPLPVAERELIAAHVSQLNSCQFCARSHAATMHHLDSDPTLPAILATGPQAAPPRLAALLRLAGHVTAGGHQVTDTDITAARTAGATDEEIHDTVLIAAAFCMINRYVDGLAATTPPDQASYDGMAVTLATRGYLRSPPPQ